MHAVTALSGSGPAYVFHLIEAMAAAGVAAGLPADTGRAAGPRHGRRGGELARLSGGDPAKLRRDVTSPGGTTAAALAVLMVEPGGLADLMRHAVAAAAERSRVLAGGWRSPGFPGVRRRTGRCSSRPSGGPAPGR